MILSKSLPKWLDADLSYFCHILDDGNLGVSEKISKIKELIKLDFRYINHPTPTVAPITPMENY